MGLKKSFFLLACCCLLASLALILGVGMLCKALRGSLPTGGIAIGGDGSMTSLPQPTPQQQHLLAALSTVEVASYILLPLGGLATAGALFYRLKCEKPIAILQHSTQCIQKHDLDFVIPPVSADELGQLCGAFETMRAELLRSNRALWRQAEERKRLNAAFSHNLRNPITVLKGTVQLLRQGQWDEQTLHRLESYTCRIEQYVEAMSAVQRLEQLPLRTALVDWATLRTGLAETARLLAPGLACTLTAPGKGAVPLDHGLFLTVAENLISNAARFARGRLTIVLTLAGGALALSVADDGPGFPAELLQGGPKPFGRGAEDVCHFGMGLYSSQLLCIKHGGSLRLENTSPQGAAATAVFQTSAPS